MYKAVYLDMKEQELSPGRRQGMAAAGLSLFCTGASELGTMGERVPFRGLDLDSSTQFSGYHANTHRLMALDNFTFRVRKRSNDPETPVKKGPMVAKHPNFLHGSANSSVQGLAEQITELMDAAKSPHRYRAGPGTIEGSFPRKRSPSLGRSRPSSPGNARNGRPPSPGALDPAVMEAVKRRVQRVALARLYLLQQPGPNSFLVGGDSPQHKYRVVIGPQTCSCGRGPHCLHLLFVMLRVFQVPESDSRIYSKELKNYEVESLFHNYQERRNSRVNGSPDLLRKSCQLPMSPGSPCGRSMEVPNGSAVDLPAADDTKSNEEELCPICLLEMVDGESLVSCNTGCHNKLHHHCMAIWAAECNQQNEQVLCPLCRCPWLEDASPARTVRVSAFHSSNQKASLICPRHPHKTNHSYAVTGNVSPSSNRKCFSRFPQSNQPPAFPSPKIHKQLEPLCVGKTGMELKAGLEFKKYSNSIGMGSMSPTLSYRSFSSHNGLSNLQPSHCTPQQSAAIPSDQISLASEWIKVFGSDLVTRLYSRDWKSRDMALSRLVNEIVTAHQSEKKEHQQKVIWCCAKILTMVAADPVFKVYLGCIRCFRVLLRYAKYHEQSELLEFSNLIRPIIRTLLLKCADRNRRTSRLTTEILVELAKGQSGESSLGYYASNDSAGLDCLELVLGCILEEPGYGSSSLRSSENAGWQWYAGRLIVLDRFVKDFPDEFALRYVPLYPNESGYKLQNYNRLITIVEFSAKALHSTHRTVSKLARHVFVLSAAMTGVEARVFEQAIEMLSGLDPAVQARLKKRLRVAAESPTAATTSNANTVFRRQHETGRVVASLDQSGITERHYVRVETRLPQHGLSDDSKMAARNKAKPVSCLPVQPASPAVRPKDLPLDLASSRIKKPVEFRHLPGINVNPSATRRWGGSGSRLYNLFTRNKKLDEVLPSKLEIHPSSLQSPSIGNGVGNAIDTLDYSPTPTSDTWSKFPSPTSPTLTTSPSSSRASPVPDTFSDQPNESEEELIIPLCLSKLVPSDRNSHFPDLRSHEQSMESGRKQNLYLENKDWKRGHVLGTGAFSTCYQARDVATGTLMAVKQVPFNRSIPEEQEDAELGILEEIVTMSKLQHRNIVRILGATRQGNHFNMFVEWMAGGSIANMLDKYGSFNDDVIIVYTKQILEGVSYLHDNHILHRDLKGANLLVDSSGQHLRIADFGASARLVSQATVSGEFQGQLLGTIAFMAPEVLRGEDYGRSCDIWSIGCCMIEMSSSKPPWKENCMSNHLALMYKIASSKDPPSIPQSVGWLVRDLALLCLRVESETRPSAKDLLHHCCFRDLQPYTNNDRLQEFV